MMLLNDYIENLFRHHWENDHHQRADDRAGEHAERERRIVFQVRENAPDRFHSRFARVVSARQLMAVKSPHPLIYTRSPECLCRSLKVSSAIPDLSSSPSPSAIMRSYCSFVACASGRSSPRLRASSNAIPLSFAACAAEKKQLCSRFCMSSPSVSSTREFAPVCEKTSRSIVRSMPNAAPSASPSANAAVLIFITMLTSAFTLAASPALPIKRTTDASSFNTGSPLRKASSFPPHIR